MQSNNNGPATVSAPRVRPWQVELRHAAA
jgi:hypothetical protein